MLKNEREKNVAKASETMDSYQKIAGVVTLYHPDEKVLENIRSYYDDLEELIVMDNTPEPDAAFVEELKKLERVRYVSYGKNRGIAEAMNEALDMVDGRYRWLLSMDQDSSFPEGKFHEYLSKLPEAERRYPNMYALSVTTLDNTNVYPEYSIANNCMTSGTLNLVSFAKKIGGFRVDFFIDEVDLEYCYRGNAAGGVVVQYGVPVMKHQLGDNFHTKFLWRTIGCMNENYIRCYYIARNRFYVMRDYPSERLRYIDEFLRWVIKLVIAEPDRWRKLRYIGKGICDFLRGKTGELKE